MLVLAGQWGRMKREKSKVSLGIGELGSMAGSVSSVAASGL